MKYSLPIRPRFAAMTAALILGAALLSAPAFAQSGLASHATTDGFAAPLVNPAATAVGNARGFALAVGYENQQSAGFVPEPSDLALYLSGRSLSYVFQRVDDDNLHSFSLAVAPLDNLYLGAGATLPSFEPSQALYRLGMLVRPANVVSLGATARYSVPPDDWDFSFGAALRPLGVIDAGLQNRVTLAVDSDLIGESFTLPRLAIETELFDGVRADVRYDLEREVLSLGASFAVRHARIGNDLAAADGGVESGSAYLHLSLNRFRSIGVARDTTYVEYAPGPAVIEQRSWPSFFPFSLMDRAIPLSELLQQIEVLGEDPDVAGIVFIDHNLRTSYANFQDIEAALRSFRDSGKEVIFYFEQTNTLNYALAASVADQIYLHPQGYLNLIGLSSVRVFLAEFLGRIGLEFVAFRSDEFKTGGDSLALDRMSDAEREALESLLESLYAGLTAAIDAGRGARLSAPAAELIDAGPYLVARRALEAGLVDDLLYRDEFEQRVEARRSNGRIVEASFPEPMRQDWSEPRAAGVALIYAVGEIHGGESDLDRTIGSATLARALRRAREDRSIEGVLLRIVSPGGSSLGSDVIAREVALTAQEKPVVVSMGGVAASGGYYIAAPASYIVAQPSTMTGSIGVYAVLPNIEDLSQRIGVQWEAVRRGDRADFGLPYRRLTATEAELIQQSIDASYQRFLEVVAEGRGIDPEEAHQAGQGRVWSGTQAAERNLVDELGGFADAVEILRGRVAPGGEIALVPVSGRRGVLPTRLPQRFIREHARAQMPYEVRLLADAIDALNRHGDEVILMRLPYDFAVE